MAPSLDLALKNPTTGPKGMLRYVADSLQLRSMIMSSFEFATSQRILFGAGKLNELGKHLEQRPKRLLFVHGRSSKAIPRVIEILSGLGIPLTEFQVHGEPTIDVVREGVKAAQNSDMVIGLGGGSVLDTGKAITALATNRGTPEISICSCSLRK